MAEVLLFNPPGPDNKGYTREGRCTQESGIWGTQWPPVSLATAASLLEEDNHRVRVVDFPAMGAGPGLLKEILFSRNPEFVFWTTGTPTLKFDLELAHLVRSCSPKAFTGVMGTHVTVDPEIALNISSIDVVIRREPEGIIRELCRLGNRDWNAVRGISFVTSPNGAREIRHNPDAAFLDPASIPAPAWHTLDLHRYRLPLNGRPFLTVAPIRGCPYPCSFCTAPVYYGRKLRTRPVHRVVDEIESNLTRFGVKDVFIWADTFTADRKYVLSLCREILKRGLRISWTCNSRVDTVDEELLLTMREAGLWMISFGLESGSDEILNSSGKRITVAQSSQAVSSAHRLGIMTAGHFILGLSGETERTMQQTLRLALDLPLDIAQFYAAAPFPGTRFHKEALNKGWLKMHQSCSQGTAVLELPGLPAAKVDAFRRHAYRRFYGRPHTVKHLLTQFKAGGLQHMLRNSLRFLRWGVIS